MSNSDTPTFSQILSRAIQSALENIWTSLPARVVSFDSSAQKASVQPTIKRAYFDESDELQYELLPVINEVPVVFLGAGGFRTTYPVKPGDFAVLVFCDYGIAEFLATGDESEPESREIHSLNDAVAILGLRPFKSPLQKFPADRMSLGSDTGCTIEISEDKVQLGSENATEKVAFASDLTTLQSTASAWTSLPTGTQVQNAAVLFAIQQWIDAWSPTGSQKVEVE